ncbi:MAG: hypothetical protein A3D24_04465 [Candidatus Blackburnbacteria bacterium RIFCSPHIGHO2_02_FULL_39_13]|uniref:Mannosyl-glycoprotein endo-beta-N-acetylglucosamidase-like domain-containing protein n=2 Tax=Patescibacteria group TaxID=1783273 RepID=A0A0G1CCL7_9BACT|nr:MAG: hypothetical protein UV20_C0012G0017 [Candidatus Magasanikbacteria bacterium GW2011_GWA2_42_32]OGY07067.1 MAG: hypothetical protein A2694_01515 [Candidatus Blackburnbacteria bacterium RIFCSPHIGHO2_01_FULL_40_17]OGY08571.1 MAG: hypothetical protein A3D24_04465 [Candidatus Blackburnbacteria bacterium RIFCSPHIGHO2_02_FULL_39_13]OGY13469.1 MAG: hypothetical protein A3A77_00045 [Candidatus Blackburnbacteria bacterium RIFCSPLOWO2_01_FULL_40_20]OGY14999.1 MAG: hypothetical protein A3I52_01380 
MRKTLYLLTFLIFTPITLVSSLYALNTLSKSKPTPAVLSASTTHVSAFEAPQYGSRVYAALPDPIGKMEGVPTGADARIEILRQYLQKYSSPLVPYAYDVVQISEKYGLDFRLLVAIAQQESNLCKKIPQDSYNCWGWGIHSRGTLRFTSYPEALETVAKGLKEEYLDKGYITPEQIMSKYTPSSPGTWAAGVNQFLQEME